MFVAEPLIKGYCKSYGKNFHTGSYVHWIQGKGDLIVGDDVLIDGKCNITFAATLHDRPTLRIGDRTVIGHGSSMVVAREITIGADCLIAGGVWMFDSPGHPSDPDDRKAHKRPAARGHQAGGDRGQLLDRERRRHGPRRARRRGQHRGGQVRGPRPTCRPSPWSMGNPARRILQLQALRHRVDRPPPPRAAAAGPTPEPLKVAT